MTFVQKIPGNFQITDPNWPRYDLRETLTSDDFSLDGALAGRTTNAALGGSPVAWIGTEGSWYASGGMLYPGPSDLDTLGVDESAQPSSMSVVVKGLAGGTGGTDRVLLNIMANADGTRRCALQIRRGRSLCLEHRHPGEETTLSDTLSGAFSVGDRVGVEVREGVIHAVVNGQSVLTYIPPSAPEPGRAFFSRYKGSGIALDDLVMRAT